MTKNLIETVLISNKDYKALLQERDELKQENSLLSYNLHLKEQENKELKQQLEIDKNQINYFIEENKELKDRNGEL